MRGARGLVVCGSAAALAVGVLPAHAGPGMLDPQFGHHGVAEFVLDGDANDFASIAAGPAGTSVVAEPRYSYTENRASWLVGRLTAQGALDPTFGQGAFVDVPTLGAQMKQVAVLPDGSVVVLGDNGTNGAVLERLTAAGTLDSAFGGPLGGGTASLSRAQAMTVQPDGKIVVVGLGNIYRFLPDGTRDVTFGVDGESQLEPRGAGILNAVTVLPDGSILAGGDGGGYTELEKLTPSGLPDLSYGTNGTSQIAVRDPDSGTIWSQALHLLPEADGNVLVTGGIGTNDAPYVARVDANGALDRTFGTDGFVNFPAHFGASTTTDGKAIYVVYTGEPAGRSTAQITVTKLTMAGAVDPSFGDSGSVSWLGDYLWTFADGSLLLGGRLTILGDSVEQSLADGPVLVLQYVVDRTRKA